MSDYKEHKKPEIKLPENVPTDYEFEKMLKIFIKKIQKDDILEEIRNRQYYIKPSEIRHKIEGAIKRKRLLQRRRKKRK